MDAATRIEQALATAIERTEGPVCPPGLAEAVRYAVFPRGARIRPRLSLAVAAACGDDRPELSLAAAISIEFLHCASLVHDDLPCFDNAATRRGKPSVHRNFGERLAVLAGDALIVLAFQTVAWGAVAAPVRLPALIDTVGRSAGMPLGIAAGQAWECEEQIELSAYQQAKTGALFAAATEIGALASGEPAGSWRLLGERLGEAYQVADDIRDAYSSEEELGKPVGQDVILGRPSAVLQLGMDGAIDRFEDLATAAVELDPGLSGGNRIAGVDPAGIPAVAAKGPGTARSVTATIVRKPGSGAFLDRILAYRDRLLASPAFQRWASGFPVASWIARRRARALFDLCAGFVYSQVLAACVRLRLFDILADGPLGVAQLAQRCALTVPAMDRLLAAAATLRLVERRGSDRYGLGSLGAAMLGNPGIAAMVEHHAMLYADLADPVALLRGTKPDGALSRYWAYAQAERPGALDDTDTAAYSTLMAVSQPMVSSDILDAYPLARHRRLLDVGGGEGKFLIAAAAHAPNLDIRLFDLPAVAERATERFAAAGIAGRAQAVGGDFRRDSLPQGADVISLVRVVHDHDDDVAMELLRAARAALPLGGTLLLAEPMSGTPGAEPIGDAYFGFYLLAMGSGRPRTAEELMAMIASAGFASSRLVATRRPMLTRLIVATA